MKEQMKPNRLQRMTSTLRLLRNNLRILPLFPFLLLSLLPAVPAMQSCGQRNGAENSETATPEIEPLQDSMSALDREIEELRRRKQELERELDTLDMTARWEVADGEHLKVAEIYDDRNTAADLVAALNRHRETGAQLPNPVLELREQRGRTVYVRLLHGERLTQQMGSAGAAQYLAEATFTLTSLRGVDSVDFEFEEGDHARPGAYTRGSWTGVFEVEGKE